MSHLDDVMIDIETLGTAPGAAILSIGAVLFGPAGLGDTFYAPVLLQSCTAVGLTIDAATVGWWFTQSDEARAAAFRFDAAPLADVLLAFSSWFAARGVKRPWCHGATFDVPLLDAAYKACGMTSPWEFRNVRDTRTLYDLAGIKVDRGVGTHHNALDDAAAQARAASTALRILSERAAPPAEPGFLVTSGEVTFHPAPAAVPKAELTATQIAAGAAVLGDDGKPIGRNAAIMVADAMGVDAGPVAAPTVHSTTAAQIRAQALEEAAQKCENRGLKWQQQDGSFALGMREGAFDAAAAIRALAGQQVAQGEKGGGAV